MDSGSDFENWTATKIQSTFRGYQCRKELRAQHGAAAHIQRQWDVHQQHEDGSVLSEDQATRIIQRAWRRFSSIKIYRYYRDMINFRERGDPAQLLRAINPREAMLLDAATGCHLRFRLGGLTFPPIIYYKIFTHRPVTDICAFGPRDYCREVTLAPKNLHSHEIPGVQNFLQDRSGWYQRVENNGWRPLSEHVLVDIDPVTFISAAKRRPFHHNPSVRKEDALLRRKQRQREWMAKMYAEGKGSVDPSVDPMARAALLQQMHEDDLDEDDRELLQWSAALDFAAYQEDWQTRATSTWSEAAMPLPHDFFDAVEEIPEIPIDGYDASHFGSGAEGMYNMYGGSLGSMAVMRGEYEEMG
uniref:Uncharacterized protein n=1 Tax=Pyramimonas obovata TaxID=1411642 RepID=A0A7S0MRA8_9CHLO|mmetsp:Transcript_11332/g.23663  ORF Transcript_11332/g.23663 Transcript_11332/m.23663 type:complete len:358 (+) Transcript_11332:398-1471(+)|eukprot:CAMPEP_0118949306 /NCGR_PEP_ID=MMETSP1169-20130426/49393_1 /TAXON_ID=36882 /ORGANISM="Pyramimonas obovata, Strain CCMP722" /LENGTH=357 /DNA_ID=CAMNT_0006895911 /DNA_START=409 /DNA_END=1482 /DNA_ORIENTATION=-